MTIKIALAAALVAIAVPMAVFANPPQQVRLDALSPVSTTPTAFGTLLLDPYAATEFSIVLPRTAAEVDIDRDPFAAVRG